MGAIIAFIVLFLILSISYILWFKRSQLRRQNQSSVAMRNYQNKVDDYDRLVYQTKIWQINLGKTYSKDGYNIKFTPSLGKDNYDANPIILIIQIDNGLITKRYDYPVYNIIVTVDLIKNIIVDPEHFYDSIS